MTITEMRDKRNKLVAAMDAFLDTHADKNGTLSEADDATYKGMESEVAAITDSIHRLERRDAIEAELNKPQSKPLTGKPMQAENGEKTGRASDEYKAAMLRALRTNFRQVSNVLQEGVDADGGYLVPEEYDSRLIRKLTEENVIRKLANHITTAGQHKINIAATTPAAAWIDEGGALTFGDATFAQINLDAHKLHVAVKVTEELLYDSAFPSRTTSSTSSARRSATRKRMRSSTATEPAAPRHSRRDRWCRSRRDCCGDDCDYCG